MQKVELCMFHIVHALKWTIEVLNGKLIVKMCIRSKECLHTMHLMSGAWAAAYDSASSDTPAQVWMDYRAGRRYRL